MRTLVVSVIALTSFAGIVLSRARAREAHRPKSDAETPPLVCRPSALTEEARRRRFEELGPALLARKTGVRELPDGYELTFPGDPETVRLLSEWTVGERACCPFLDIGLDLARDSGPLRLRLAGGNGVKQFIESEGAEWLK